MKTLRPTISLAAPASVDVATSPSLSRSDFLRPLPLSPISPAPLVSVLISNHNYAAFLADAIKSVLFQTYPNFELIICDDGSTDNSLEILARYISADPRVRILSQRNLGQAAALNLAFSASRGEILCLLDADDLFAPDKLQSVIDGFLATPRAGFAIHRMIRVDRSRNFLGRLPLIADLPHGWCGAAPEALVAPRMIPGLPPSSGLSLRRAVANAIFPINEDLRAYADTPIQVLAPMITPILAIERNLGEYRVHAQNTAARSQYGADQLRALATYDEALWRMWRDYLARASRDARSSFPLPPESAASFMEYAHARFTSNPAYRSLYSSALQGPRYRAMPAAYRCYWKTSIAVPNWLFKKSFAIVYGQHPIKLALGRISHLLRRIIALRAASRPSSGENGSFRW